MDKALNPVKFKEDLELEFVFLICQFDQRRNKVHYWVDGSTSKKTCSIPVFEKQLRAKNPELHSNVQQIMNTYSFYIISSKSAEVKKLDPTGKDSPYKDELGMYFNGKVKLSTEEKSLVESLYTLGFNPISEEDIKNFNISIGDNGYGLENSKQSFLRNILDKIKRK